jgi:hypothetical protein
MGMIWITVGTPPGLIATLEINKDCSPNHESFTAKLYRGGYKEVKELTLDFVNTVREEFPQDEVAA